MYIAHLMLHWALKMTDCNLIEDKKIKCVFNVTCYLYKDTITFLCKNHLKQLPNFTNRNTEAQNSKYLGTRPWA